MGDGEIIAAQLAEANRGAGGYFTKRVELLLQDRRPEAPAELYRFLKAYWPDFKVGYLKLQQEK